ncbi:MULTISPECIES: hypothetical protein [Gordonia]|uniref:Uncharacterized protein n=2 Tax=Gordonia TaxID=2053 RepID=A0A9X3I3H2_9ACTN|nr:MULTISPECIES: hypothetical protein [Gordonia]MCF3941122.1 hypothetical protein [Gordonia tangerina]MCX2963161.1 hypothetical protein [Gordonia aquimaris]
MGTPSWIELAGRNAAAEAICLSGTLTATEKNEASRVDFQHAPGGKWCVEHEGQPVYIASGATAVVRVEGHMRRLDGDIRLPMLGARFSPLDLLGRESLIHKMSTSMAVEGDAEQRTIGGRAAWSIRLRAPERDPIEMTFDDATGVLIRLATPDGRVALTVDGLSVPETLPDSLFEWDGPVLDERPTRGTRRSDEDDETERIEALRALIAAHSQPDRVMAAIAGADSERGARSTLVELLGVTESGADHILAAPIGIFRGDHAVANRRTLEIMEDERRQ